MCGILFSVFQANEGPDSKSWEALKVLNTKRGPDAQQEYETILTRDPETYPVCLRFFSTVLHLRGPKVVGQPMHDAAGNVLCWNGEIFGGLPVPDGANDTQCLMDQLSRACAATETDLAIMNILSRIEGPFAFVFWQVREAKLWFGRDCLGRRSLLWSHTDGSLSLSSVGMPLVHSLEDTAVALAQDPAIEKGTAWSEVPANGIYYVQLGQPAVSPSGNDGDSIVCGSPMLLFPWSHEPSKDTILTLPFGRLNTTLPTENINTETVPDGTCDPEITPDMERAITDFSATLSAAVKDRVADVPHLRGPGSARVAVLFSGGLDCICLAAMAHAHLPLTEPIDLINVAFENPRVEGAKRQAKKDTHPQSSASLYETPDRKTGRAGVAELRHIASDRVWNFVEVNVPFEEAQTHRQEIIDRMFPLDTVMDLSIAMAFWFAARGKGAVNNVTYHSQARVLLSGLGADEQLGGYSRHREAFRQGGWERLLAETQLDIDRISTRNLGRDDRIMSDHGKEVRFPFLCTNVVSWLCKLPMNLKMDLRYGRGVGEKLLLRHVARRLGLEEASRNWKRAIQFGAKTAKMTTTTRSEKGQHKLT